MPNVGITDRAYDPSMKQGKTYPVGTKVKVRLGMLNRENLKVIVTLSGRIVEMGQPVTVFDKDLMESGTCFGFVPDYQTSERVWLVDWSRVHRAWVG